MSQRLHVGPTDLPDHYDCVVTDKGVLERTLRSEWLQERGPFFSGPWKITIGDRVLYLEIEPLLIRIFDSLGRHYPDDIWVFHEGERYIEHPTQAALHGWLQGES